MDKMDIIRRIAIEFALYIDTQCVRDIDGWFIIGDTIKDTNTTVFEVDELYDYWIDNVYLSQ